MSLVVSAQETDPVSTKGSWFWKDEERFLIKGISYLPRQPDSNSYSIGSKIDPLDDGRLDDLKRDIEVFHELGLNTIQISALRPDKSHRKAMALLEDAGMHVLVTLLQDFRADDDWEGDSAKYYTADLLRPVLRVVDEMAKYSNLLGFVVGAEQALRQGYSPFAPVYRAAVRDIKAFLRQLDGRAPPVGVSVNDNVVLKRYILEYFTADDRHDRADFFGMDCWSWAAKSNFQISGWKNMVEVYSKYPVPMYLSAFGAYVGKRRLWEEIGCLFSPDMTGVFSGGCLYTYFEHGNRYGIVEATEGGIERRDKEFARLKKQFHMVNMRDEDDVYVSECKDYEGWRGDFPVPDQRWLATSDVPLLAEGLENLTQDVRAEKEGQAIDIATFGNIGKDYGDIP